MVIQAFSDKFEKNLMAEQEIMMNIADMMMQVYAAESTLLRIEKLDKTKSDKDVEIYHDILNVFVYDASSKIFKAAKDAISSFEKAEKLQPLCEALYHFTKVMPVNVKDARRRIAERLIYDNRYTF
jgi:hypothetical protein